MAHKALIGGTAYEITGGKTLIDGTGYSISGGKTLVDGTGYDVGFGGGGVDTGNALEFVSAEPFTLRASAKGWNGTIEYANGGDWATWDGNSISSGETEKGQCIYLRGTGNTKITAGNSYIWKLTGTEVYCNGNIETLLDYATVANGNHPSMIAGCFYYLFYNNPALVSAPDLPATTLTAVCYGYMFTQTSIITPPALPATTLAKQCYMGMFENCSLLTTAPSLPATTLADSCYRGMFFGCTNLAAIPALPATTLKNYCYQQMFMNCTKLKLSTKKLSPYLSPYRIPTSETGSVATDALKNMLMGVNNTVFTPTINTTYYYDPSVITVV